jgi:hypothetical protein
MTKRDLFRIIIKVFALYSLIIGLTHVVPQNISLFSTERMFGSSGYAIYVMIFSITFIVLLTWLLMKKADTIISWFKLDQGYDTDETTLTQFNTEFIFTIATVIVGGFLIVDYAPMLIVQSYNAFKFTQNNGFLTDDFKTDWALSVIRVFAGYLLIKFAPKMHLLVVKKDKNDNDSASTPQ